MPTPGHTQAGVSWQCRRVRGQGRVQSAAGPGASLLDWAELPQGSGPSCLFVPFLAHPRAEPRQPPTSS